MNPTDWVEIVISVIVPVKNGLPWLEEQMRALFDQKCCYPWEVIVADNGSTDHPRRSLRDSRVNMPACVS